MTEHKKLKFDELLERIPKKEQEEYKEKVENIPKIIATKSCHSFGVTYFFWSIFVYAFWLIVLPLWKLAFSPELFITISLVALIVIKLMWYSVIIGFILDLVFFLLREYKKYELKKEYFHKYFDVEIKLKKESKTLRKK